MVISKILLTDLIDTWDIIHKKNLGELGFSDLCKALEDCRVIIVNNIKQQSSSQFCADCKHFSRCHRGNIADCIVWHASKDCKEWESR